MTQPRLHEFLWLSRKAEFETVVPQEVVFYQMRSIYIESCKIVESNLTSDSIP